MKLRQLTIREAGKLLKKKEITASELTAAVLDRISEVEKHIDAYITVCAESAAEEAKKADESIMKGDITPLTGIPLAVKDLMCTKRIKTTCGSKILENFIPPYDATVIKKIKEAGAVIIGKTNMDEFAMGSTTENSSVKPTRNPWDTDRIPGGSSGGSAAAISADMCIGALGSDTGGSIRQPASLCGVSGFKPTYGRVSRYGLVAFASSLDQIGPLAKDVEDCALLLNMISGYDPKDSTSITEESPDYTSFLQKGLKSVKIGIPKEYYEVEGLDKEVSESVLHAVKRLEDLGAERIDISLPNTKYGIAAYYIIAPSEASSNLARYDGVRYGLRKDGEQGIIEMFNNTRSAGFGPEVIRRIILGTYSLSSGYYDAYYKKASQVRTLIMEDFNKAFESCDVIVCPVSPTPAVKIGELSGDPLAMYLSDVFTLPASLAGIPGISVPCGFTSNGLPIGLQILSRRLNEADVLRTAYNFQQNSDFHLKKPNFQ